MVHRLATDSSICVDVQIRIWCLVSDLVKVNVLQYIKRSIYLFPTTTFFWIGGGGGAFSRILKWIWTLDYNYQL